MKFDAEISGPVPPYLLPPEPSKEPITSDEEGDEEFSNALNALINASNWAIYAQACFMRCSDYAQHKGVVNMSAAMAQAVTATALGADALLTITERYMPDKLKDLTLEQQEALRDSMLREKTQA